MSEMPYSIEYEGDVLDEITYNGQSVDIIKIGDNYVPVAEATYLTIFNNGDNFGVTSTETLLSFTVINDDNHTGYILYGNIGEPPKILTNAPPNYSTHQRIAIKKGETLYLIIPFRHTLTSVRGVSYDRYTFKESIINAYWFYIGGRIGGRCNAINRDTFIYTSFSNMEFSPKFTGELKSSAINEVHMAQPELNLGGTTVVGESGLVNIYKPYGFTGTEFNFTLTTSANLTSFGGFYMATGRYESGVTYNITINMPTTNTDVIATDVPNIGFTTINPNYPNSTITNVTYNFSEALDEESAKLCFPGLYNEDLGGFAYRRQKYASSTPEYKLANTYYILPAYNVRFNKQACSIDPPAKVNVSAEFCEVLGNSEQREIINGFVLGKSRLGDGSVYVSEYPYYVGRYMSNEYGTFNAPYTIHLETTTKTKTLTLMFDEQNDYHPTYISYSYVNSAGQTIMKTNADNTSRVTLTFDEPTKIIDITISTWNMPEEPLIITGIYAGDLENE